MEEFNIFKIEYSWYEGEHRESLVGKKVTIKEFENDLIKAKEFAESLRGKVVKRDYLGKGYSVECLPQYYEQILWFLANKLEYIECYFDENVSYDIDDSCLVSDDDKINVEKVKKMIVRKELAE